MAWRNDSAWRLESTNSAINAPSETADSSREPEIKPDTRFVNPHAPVRAVFHMDPESSRIATMGETNVARQAGKKQPSPVIAATIPVENRTGPRSSTYIPNTCNL